MYRPEISMHIEPATSPAEYHTVCSRWAHAVRRDVDSRVVVVVVVVIVVVVAAIQPFRCLYLPGTFIYPNGSTQKLEAVNSRRHPG